MADTLGFENATPHSVIFAFVGTTANATNFVRAGVPDSATVTLAQLAPGPLRSYLTRKADWSTLSVDPRLKFRFVDPVGALVNMPVDAAVAHGIAITLGVDAITFNAPSATGLTAMNVELSFVHSMAR
jgi:hypothetical protein